MNYKEESESQEVGSEPSNDAGSPQLEPIQKIFRDQLIACLEECSSGRRGLFASSDFLGQASRHQPWPEAERLRELAFALQSLEAQSASEFQSQEAAVPRASLAEQFLDLCSIHGEADPGEPRLARAFLSEIQGGL